MARVFKPKYTRDGKTYAVGKYNVTFKDPAGILRRVPAFSMKAPSEALGRRLEALAATRANIEPMTPDLRAWVESLAPDLRARLVSWGMLDRGAEDRASLSGMLDTFEASITARGKTEMFAMTTASRCRTVFEALGFEAWADLDPERIESHLQARQDAGELKAQDR